jgi:hypothetical protein
MWEYSHPSYRPDQHSEFHRATSFGSVVGMSGLPPDAGLGRAAETQRTAITSTHWAKAVASKQSPFLGAESLLCSGHRSTDPKSQTSAMDSKVMG